MSQRIPGRPCSRRRDAGFTLIELLVVIVIVGMLAAIAIPTFLNQRKKAVDSSVKTDARSVAIQLEAYWTERGAYPSPVAIPPEVALAGRTLTVGTDPMQLSPGNTPKIWLDGPYRACVQVTNPKATDPTHGYVWQADNGGLQPNGSDCSGYSTPLL